VADYGVNIKVAVQNSQKVKQLGDDLKRTGNVVDLSNKLLAKMAGVTSDAVANVKNLNAALAKSQENFNKAVFGTKSFVLASKDLIATNKEVTRSLEQRAAALKRIESGQAISPTFMGSAASQRQSQFAKLEETRKRALRASNRDFQQQIAEQSDLERTKAQKSLEIKKKAAGFRLSQAKKEQQFEENLERIGAARRKQQSAIARDRQQLQNALGKMEERSKTIDENRTRLQQKSLRIGRQRVQAVTREVLENKKLTKEQQRQLALQQQQRRQKLGGAISSGLIGGGFPLLFGQGGAAAAGGAIGGLAGGAIGGGFGFALSIVGTAIGQALEDAENFDRSLNELNATLSTSGTVSSTTAADVRALASELNIAKEEAVELLGTFSGFGDGDIREELARVFEPVGGRQTLDLLVKARLGEKETLAAISGLSEIITLEKAEELQNQLDINGALVTAALLQEAVLEKSREITQESEKTVGPIDHLVSGLAMIANAYAGMAYGPALELEPPPTPEELAEERAAGVAPPDKSVIDTALAGYEQYLQRRQALDKKYSITGTEADPTISLQKRLGVLNKQIASEERVVGLSSEAESIVKRRLAFESKVAQIEEAGRAERQRLTEQEDIALSRSIETQAVKLETLKFEREMTSLIDRQNKAGEELLKPLQKKLDAIRDRNAFEKEYGELIMSGSTPAAAKQVIEAKKQILEIERLVEKQLESNAILIANLEIAVDQAKTTKERVAAEEALNRALERRNEIEEKGRIAKGEVKGEKTPAERIDEERKRIQGTLNELMDPVNQLISLANTLGDAFSESFKGLVTGSMTAQQALANLFQRTADHFIDMAAQMIAAQIKMKILGIGMSFFGGGIGGGGGASSVAASAYGDFSVAGPGFFSGGMIPGFANGGRPPVGRPSIVGERGPELFVPDRAGTIVPNHAMGSANVVVNVDASGSSVEGDADQAQQLGKAIGIAVQQELVKQKRPGGLLARSR